MLAITRSIRKIICAELFGAVALFLYSLNAAAQVSDTSHHLVFNTVAGPTYSWTGPGHIPSLQNPFVSTSNPGIFLPAVTNSLTVCASILNVVPSIANAATSTWSGGTDTINPTAAVTWNSLTLFDGTSDLVIPAELRKYQALTANEKVHGLLINIGGYEIDKWDVVTNS